MDQPTEVVERNVVEVGQLLEIFDEENDLKQAVLGDQTGRSRPDRSEKGEGLVAVGEKMRQNG